MLLLSALSILIPTIAAIIVNNHGLLVAWVENHPANAMALLERVRVAHAKPLEATGTFAQVFLAELFDLFAVDSRRNCLDE
ncbi:hypothetical protein Ptr902_09495 [Pyrenophora tritici-repentis]|uniref:Uncharacterized protein n=1 Tax=Pyrenophora tritici-repentis TaxID=45151 RepID=A0A2W1EA71_9PLEO|nr:hypothetical protein PtrV1_10482 [Pyrenophora tritici-repentis]KAF7446462.1 hypothetical protein A1F99_097530 [Pyrenophora tritici-repentis]KAF7567577.1 hypothetical protein PtrM4_141680 [Pyrenophora tritici-repentis]KAI1527875.1 hypothetical protein PtrSN001C_009685 [Pyrenophora tritici-repentis]KAI1568432.1 hypothetical protein PtrEW4_006457 [Pyrenophora tritici-repentis]